MVSLYLPLSDHGRTIHPSSAILEHAVGVQSSGFIQAIVSVDHQSVIFVDFKNRWAMKMQIPI